MVPNKFEEYIKEKLEAREIAPSADAWHKLADQLGASQKPKSSGYLWYGVAASAIGVLLVSVLYFSSRNQTVTTKVQVVDVAKEAPKKIIISEPIVAPFEVEIEESDKVELIVANEKATVKNQPIGLKKQILQIHKVETMSNEIQVAIKTSDEVIATKVLEVLAQVEALENKSEVVTDAEVDSLLRQAQQELFANRVFNKHNNTVDAMALLTEVEDELDQSFRDKIFENLKNGFIKVRTAVANRNN